MEKRFGAIKILSIIFLGTGFLSLCAGMTFYMIDLLRGNGGE